MPLVSFDDFAGWPAAERARVVLTPAQQTTLFSAPVTIITGRTGYAIIPAAVHVRKEAGTAWTTTGSGVLRFSHNNPATSIIAQLFSQGETTTFFGAAEASWIGNAGGSYNTGTNFISGSSVNINLGTADISGGTGNLIVVMWYRMVPVAL